MADKRKASILKQSTYCVIVFIAGCSGGEESFDASNYIKSKVAKSSFKSEKLTYKG